MFIWKIKILVISLPLATPKFITHQFENPIKVPGGYKQNINQAFKIENLFQFEESKCIKNLQSVKIK